MRCVATAAIVVLAACGDTATISGRLTARPHAVVTASAAPGIAHLGLGGRRDGVLYVPRQSRPAYPLMLLLHGAGGRGERIERRMEEIAERSGFIILAPDSRDETWDAIRGRRGPDVAFIDRALQSVFSRYPIDAAHVAVAGFSDGASYALTIGIMNGDLFTHVIAFSPGFSAASSAVGRPPIFLSHGTSDEILPFERSRDNLVPALRNIGYRVQFREFDGPHTVPAQVAQEAVGWWLD
jgi:phospholipase/carboxylesterase